MTARPPRSPARRPATARPAGAWLRAAGRLAAAALAIAAVGPAHGQILGGRGIGLPGVGDIARPTVPGVTGLTDRVFRTASELADLRKLRLDALVDAHLDLLERDGHGDPVVRGEVVAISPDPAVLRAAESAGFRVAGRESLDDLGLELVTLSAPRGMSARAALRRLRAAAPQGRFDLDHIHETSGLESSGHQSSGGAGIGVTAASVAAGGAPVGRPRRIGMIDTGAEPRHPALRGAIVRQQTFAAGPVTPRTHGAAVASLLVGHAPPFRGAAPGADLWVADVYGSGPVGGASIAIARALGWMAKNHVEVINISLVGPDDLTLRTVVEAMVRRGFVIVAAAGNDGPAAPPAFPASYPGVIAVTAVDGRGRVLPEAGRPAHLDFAAPGADMAAASTEGWTAVRGTSFAAPLVAGRIAELTASAHTDPPASGTVERARLALMRSARPLTVAGRRIGLVGEDLRVAPAAVGVRGVGARGTVLRQAE